MNTSELVDMSRASLATFNLAWCVPPDAKDGKVSIQDFAVLPQGEKLTFDDASLSVSSFATAVEQGTFKDKEEFANWLMSYYRQPNPARVLAAYRLLADDKQAFTGAESMGRWGEFGGSENLFWGQMRLLSAATPGKPRHRLYL